MFYGSPNGPSRPEIASLVLLSMVLFISAVTLAHGYAASVDRFGEIGPYMSVASGIRHWDLRSIHVVEQFWGLPYAMAVLSRIIGLSDRASLLTLSLLPSLLAVTIALRLWNGWVAGYFAILNFDWMQRMCLGGSEPLFVCLLLGAFLAVCRQYWWVASLLAAYATIVRPLGIFALIGIGLALLWKREYGKFSAALVTGLTVGALYVLPLKIHFGDPLANVHGYQSGDRPMFGFPFAAIIEGTSLSRTPWTNLALSCGWIFFVLGATVAMVMSRDFRKYFRTYAVEACFFFRLFVVPVHLQLHFLGKRQFSPFFDTDSSSCPVSLLSLAVETATGPMGSGSHFFVTRGQFGAGCGQRCPHAPERSGLILARNGVGC